MNMDPEIMGIDGGNPVYQKIKPYPIRSYTIKNNELLLTERGRIKVNLYYDERMAIDYKKPKPFRRARTQKRNPMFPAVSFIPRATIIGESPLVNVADFTQTDAIEARANLIKENEIPLTVYNAMPDSRAISIRAQRRSLNRILDTRSQYRSTVRNMLDTVLPNRTQIVDVHQHRAAVLNQTPAINPLANLIQQAIQGASSAV